MPFISPKTLAALRDLELAARTVVDGFMYGVHPSRLPGAGIEFSQYRSYQPGDDPRRVDWKLFARSDRYFVREAEIETSVTVRLLVDHVAQQVVRHRPRRRDVLDLQRNRIGLEHPDPDRQRPAPLLVAEDHDGHVADRVDHQAFDAHFDLHGVTLGFD